MKSLTLTIPYIGIATMCAACFLPPVRLYMDTLFLPKQHLFLCGLSMFLMSFSFATFRIGAETALYRCLHIFKATFSAMAVFECLYVFIEVFLNGMCEAGVSGTFDNPAGLALSVCAAIPILMRLGMERKGKSVKSLCLAMCIIMVFVVLLTKSRTGMMCAAMYALILVAYRMRMAITNLKTRWITCTAAAVLLLASVLFCAFSRKSNSTSGRYFILQQTCSLVKEHPFMGLGTGGFEREYMLCQADFFRRNHQSEYAQLADDVHHPLNEYMRLWVDYGIAGPIALLMFFMLAVWIGIREDRIRHTGLPLALLSVAIFCFFSYPFHYQASWLVVVMSAISILIVSLSKCAGIQRKCMKLGSGVSASVISIAIASYVCVDSFHELEWRKAYIESVHGNHKDALRMYERASGYFKRDWCFLYSYSLAAFMADDMDKALEKIDECGIYFNGYDRELLAGDICLAMQSYDGALRHYDMAAYMCPVRFAPLEGMYRAFDKQGMDASRDSVARIIANKRVKVDSHDVQRIKSQCSE